MSSHIIQVWMKVAFVGHDSGHNGITHIRRKDSVICLVTTALVGIGMSYWKNSHNVHHLVVNSFDCDPDIQVSAFCKGRSRNDVVADLFLNLLLAIMTELVPATGHLG